MNSVKEPTQETQLDNPIRSPFQLNKTKGPVKLIPLHAAIRGEGGHGTSSSQSTSATSSSSSIGTLGSGGDIMSPKSTLGESPFSFNVQKIESVNLSPRSSLGGSFNSDSQKLIEHQKEIAKLKRDIETKNKDIESKEAKLSSSVKSIKQFWSPELKKERALRKDEEERNRILEEKCQECQATLQQLETNLNSKDEEINSLSELNKEQSIEIDSLQNEIEKLNEQCHSIITLDEKLIELQETNRIITEESHKKSITIRELETIIHNNGKLEEDYITIEEKLELEYEAHDETRQLLEKYKEETKKLQEDQSAEEYKKDLAQLEEELYSVKELLTQQEKLYEIACDDVEELQKTERIYRDQVGELEYKFSTKERECERLQQEISQLNEVIKKTKEDFHKASKAQQQSEHKYKDLRDSQQHLVKEYDGLKDVHESTEAEKVDLENEIERLLQKIQEFGTEEEKLVDENSRLEGEIGNILACQEESKSTLIALENAEKRLSKQLQEKEEKLETALEEMRKYEKENQELLKQNTDIAEQMKEIREKLKTQITENMKLIKAEDKWQKDHQKSQQSIKELDERIRTSDAKSQQMSDKLHRDENHIAELENQLQKCKSEGMSAMILSEDLKLKTQEVQDISVKYNNLNKYLSEREVALDNSREEVAELKVMNKHYISTNTQLKTQAEEQKVLLDKLGKEKSQLQKTKEECVPMVLHKKLKSQFDDKEKALEEKEETLKDLQNQIKEKEKAYRELEEKLKNPKEVSESNGNADHVEIEKLKAGNDELSKEINFLKMKVSTLEKQRAGSMVEEKPLVAKKNLWDELSRKDARIEELEKLLKEKGRQLTAMKKSKNTEWEKQQIKISETKKIEDDVEGQLAKLKTDNEQKANRISLLEEALREMVAVAKERENIMARYAEVYEEVESKYEEADREYSRICFERSITNIKNALLILILCVREAQISSMKASYKGYLDELFALRQERLMSSISEMDTQIAHFESQTSRNKREDVSRMRTEKEKYVTQLKEHNNLCMRLNSNEDKIHCITNELKEAPSEQVYEAIRHLLPTNSLLESKVEEFLVFLRDKNADILKDISNVPVRNVRPLEQIQLLTKEDLMKELTGIEEHSAILQKFVEDLLTLLEGDQ